MPKVEHSKLADRMGATASVNHKDNLARSIEVLVKKLADPNMGAMMRKNCETTLARFKKLYVLVN